MRSDYRFDVSTLKKSRWVSELRRYLADYDKKARRLFEELDTKSRLVRNKGLMHLGKLSKKFTQTRRDLERKVSDLVQKESKRLNDGVNEFLDYVLAIAKAPKQLKPNRRKRRPAKRAQTRRQASDRLVSSVSHPTPETSVPPT